MELKSVGILSAGKIMGALGALGGLFGGAMFALISLAGGVLQQQQAGGNNLPIPAIFFGVGSVIILPIIYGIFGFMGGLIYALLYNLVAMLVGGLELDLRPTNSSQY